MEKILRGLLGIFLIGMFLVPGVGLAETTGEVAVLKAQIDALSRKLEVMDSKMMTMEKPAPGAQTTYIPPAEESKGGLLRTAMADIHMGGYVETQFQNKVGEPQQNGNVGRSLTDKAADTFSMNAAKLWFEKAANPEGGAGFRIDMMMGSDARYYFNNFQKDNAGAASTSSATAFAFEQAYVQFIAPLTFWAGSNILPHTVDVKAGRMVTLAGNEVIEGPNNWNISRSVSFGYAIPFTHTGVRASYKLFNDYLTVYQGINNGWDNDIDNNSYKTFENAFSFSPLKDVTWTTATYFGPENNGASGGKRFLATNVLGWNATKKLSFAGEFDIGNQPRVDLAGNDTFHTAQWFDYAAYARYQ
ncbi:MAG: outer membrane beta-barrel protein, partial [Candidatus Omnitrophica bacterium]|nr:outer membrane beta-barrel protein [Candidatus Omnitrophota bacterium]